MMRYGKCKNCWWYKALHGDGGGICYMQTVNPATDTEEPHYVDGDSWCPDYANRERTNKLDKLTLDEWLQNIKNRNKLKTIHRL